MNELSAKLGRLGNDTSDYDSKKLVGDLAGMLNNRFGEVVVVKDVAESKNQQCSLSLALDIRVQAGSTSFSTTTVEMSGVFADARENEINALTGAGKANVPYPATSLGVSAAWGRATALGEQIGQSNALVKLASTTPKQVAAVAQTNDCLDATSEPAS
ncbi:MAG: hypothetical protein IPJ38_03550 [Dechloromonas sp.]|uniref:Uncharacterized protein n=1 Tax=Candidatus Dechloromonas phosphorivorans TaxID=2899244 RepID=A0A935MQ19_9RHOO|nr:hypothetical protein [Candidatus Dechloromonas phosphorivorans]